MTVSGLDDEYWQDTETSAMPFRPRPLPVGTLLLLFGLLVLAFAGLAAYGCWLALSAEYLHDDYQAAILYRLGGMTAAGTLLGSSLIYFGLRFYSTTPSPSIPDRRRFPVKFPLPRRFSV